MSGSDWIEELKMRIDLMEVAQQYTEMQKKGSSWRGPCPLHDGDDPNFSVNTKQGFYKCFVCGESGDAFTLVEEMEAVEFIEAAKKLAKMFGVEVPDQRGGRQLGPEERKRQSLQNRTHKQAQQDPAWNKLNLQELVEDFRLGLQKSGKQKNLLIPMFGRRTIPAGWLAYTLTERQQPWRRDFHPTSDPKQVRKVLFGPRNIRGLIRNQPVIIVDDPMAALQLFRQGHQAVVAPAQMPTDPDHEGVLRDSHLAELADMELRQVAFLFPMGGQPHVRKQRMARLHATEVKLLAHGIEPLAILPQSMRENWEQHCQPAHPENRSSWGRIQTLTERQQPIEKLFSHNRFCVDIFQMRVGRLARQFSNDAEQPITHPRALSKIRPSLRAAQKSQRRALYHAYMAWAGRELGFEDRWRFSKLIDRQQQPAAYETF